MPDRINHLAVWVAAIVYYVFGAAWFTAPGSTWTPLVEKAKAASPMIFSTSFVLGLILAYATAAALATQSLNAALYAGQRFLLWLIDTAYVAIGFAIIGAIVGGWKQRVKVPA